MEDFQLHPLLQQNTLWVTDLALSRLVLMNDNRFPWLILVPRKMALKELFELSTPDQNKMLAEITQLSQYLKMEYKADKINVAAIGNIVPQLHIHLVARKESDAAWPAPVWGFEKSIPYSAEKANTIITHLKRFITDSLPKLL